MSNVPTKGYWRVIDTAGIIDSFQVVRVLQTTNTDKVIVEFTGYGGDHLCNIKRFKWLDKIEEAEEDFGYCRVCGSSDHDKCTR